MKTTSDFITPCRRLSKQALVNKCTLQKHTSRWDRQCPRGHAQKHQASREGSRKTREEPWFSLHTPVMFE